MSKYNENSQQWQRKVVFLVWGSDLNLESWSKDNDYSSEGSVSPMKTMTNCSCTVPQILTMRFGNLNSHISHLYESWVRSPMTDIYFSYFIEIDNLTLLMNMRTWLRSDGLQHMCFLLQILKIMKSTYKWIRKFHANCVKWNHSKISQIPIF